MARARSLKPGFFKNEELAGLPFEHRLLFQGLWVLADRAGRLEDRPKRIKAEIFPYDQVDTDAGLTSLHESGFIIRYRADGGTFIQISTWAKHQRPHHQEAESEIPEYDPAKLQKTNALPILSRSDSHQGAKDFEPRSEAVRDKVRSNPPLTLNPEPLTLNLGGGAVAEVLKQAFPEPPPPPFRPEAGPDPDEAFSVAARLVCESLPAGGDPAMTKQAIITAYQSSASFLGRPVEFADSISRAVSKWRSAYDQNPHLRPKPAQWWIRDGTYAISPPKPQPAKKRSFADLDKGGPDPYADLAK